MLKKTIFVSPNHILWLSLRAVTHVPKTKDQTDGHTSRLAVCPPKPSISRPHWRLWELLFALSLETLYVEGTTFEAFWRFVLGLKH